MAMSMADIKTDIGSIIELVRKNKQHHGIGSNDLKSDEFGIHINESLVDLYPKMNTLPHLAGDQEDIIDDEV